MKVKRQQKTAVDAMQMLADPSAWAYYSPDLWGIVQGNSPSPDSDSDQEEDGAPAMPGFQGGTPPDFAMAMSGLPGYAFDNVGPLSISERDVLNELVQELGIVGGQNPAVLPPVTQPQPAIPDTNKPPVQSDVNLVDTNQHQVSKPSDLNPSVVLSISDSTTDGKSKTTAKPKPTKKEQSSPPSMDDILAKPVKSHKAVDVDAVMERNRKNAIQARINRQKKKQQMDLLEEQIAELEEDKKALEVRCSQQEKEKDILRQEVNYLRSVLANQSVLAGLLKNVNHTDGAMLRSSLPDRKRVSETMESTPQEKKFKTDVPDSTAGVCLHVDSDVVSLEFCEKCAQMAKSTAEAS